ncbi:hypothetical protein COCNU_02G019180 [Cocos nucifera]|uniref:Methionyl-tRNA synthetase n=1 Tax=Cocos nucifera TaxID=13894 RepID=A0A8K0I0P6_COCNU|nr:hypothetical protein COCNU_02G019180 [Cocos nucifera]
MCLVIGCKGEERVLGSQPAPGSCPYCGGKVMVTDVESAWTLCFLPLCFKVKRKFRCTLCERRLSPILGIL